MSVPKRQARPSVGRYTDLPHETSRGPSKAPSVNIRTAIGAVPDPENAARRRRGTINRQADLLEWEHSHGRLSVGAYAAGREAQGHFEQLGRSASNWSSGGRGDVVEGQKNTIVRSLVRAKAAVDYQDWTRKHLDRRDAAMVRHILGEGRTYAEVAAYELRFGEREIWYTARRFRDALETLADAAGATGVAKRDEQPAGD